MNRTKGDKLFDIINILLLLLLLVIIVIPLWYVIVASVSDPKLVVKGEVVLWPKGLMLESYLNVLNNQEIGLGYLNSLIYTFFGVVFSLFVTFTAAFSLSRKAMPLRRSLTTFFVFTMFFNGGLIPTYLLIQSMGMVDTRGVMIIPGALNVFFMIIVRSYYQNNIPEELYESAKIDGCSEIGMFLRITLPLSGSILAVMVLYYGVGQWNAYFNAMIYLNNNDFFPLQLILRNILLMNQQMSMNLSSLSGEAADLIVQKTYMAETMKYSLIFIASLPVLIAYPFVQKHFVKGVMVGAVKG